MKSIKLPCHMMATKATHKLGDLSRDEPEICLIEEEDEENYIGRWVEGFGFVEVKFPKETTRALTKKEVDYYNSQHVQISGGPSVRMRVG